MKKEKSLATTLNAYYRNKGEKMPSELKLLIFNYNIEKKPFSDLVILANGDKDKDKGDIDGDKDKEEVIKFILDPENAYILGKFGHSSAYNDREPRLVVGGKVIKSHDDVLRFLL